MFDFYKKKREKEKALARIEKTEWVKRVWGDIQGDEEEKREILEYFAIYNLSFAKEKKEMKVFCIPECFQDLVKVAEEGKQWLQDAKAPLSVSKGTFINECILTDANDRKLIIRINNEDNLFAVPAVEFECNGRIDSYLLSGKKIGMETPNFEVKSYKGETNLIISRGIETSYVNLFQNQYTVEYAENIAKEIVRAIKENSGQKDLTHLPERMAVISTLLSKNVDTFNFFVVWNGEKIFWISLKEGTVEKYFLKEISYLIEEMSVKNFMEMVNKK